MTDSKLSVRYNVAISLLSKDIDFGRSLVGALSGLQVFFYLNEATRLTGVSAATGPMRRAFGDTQLNVILYRPPWGEFDFTKLERDAIVDAYLKKDALDPFLIRMDKGDPKLPEWFPKHIAWCDPAMYTVEQIADQIRDKLGSEPVFRVTPDNLATWGNVRFASMKDMAAQVAKLKLIEAQKAEQQRLLKTSDGFDRARAYMANLADQIGIYAKQVQELDEDIDFRWGRNGPSPYWFVISSGSQSVQIKWDRDGGPSVRGDTLRVEFCSDPSSVPGQTQPFPYFHGQGRDPKLIKRYKFDADISLSGAFRWRFFEENIVHQQLGFDEVFLDFDELARFIVGRFHELHYRGPNESSRWL